MIYHNIYDSWAWVGGHADGDEDLVHVVKKEIEEQENDEDTLSELDVPQLPATTQIPTAERSLKGVTYEISNNRKEY